MPNLSGPTNVTDKVITDFYLEALPIHRMLKEAQEEVRSVNGTLRNIYKRAKESGVPQKAIAKLLAERLLDPEEVTKELHDYVRARAAIGAMPNKQMSLFIDLLKKEPEPESNEAITRERVWDDGYFAGTDARNRDTNPHLQGTDHHDTWDRAWIAGQTKNAEGLYKSKPVRVAKPKAGKLGAGKKKNATEAEAPTADAADAGETADAPAAEVETIQEAAE